MEFGIFVQAHVPQARVEADGPAAEHNALLNEIDLVREADRLGWKYVWITEHHFLKEYSHLSASEVFLGYLAAVTDRIHLGSGIFNLNPAVNHPIRVAERVAMLDHLSDGRFEFGTGRGAGSLEVTGFGIEGTHVTKAVWDEVVRQFTTMWADDPYAYQGTAFSTPHPNCRLPALNVLPKPWKKPHPPMWVACGNPPTYEKAARLGLGALGFNVAAIRDMEPMVRAYKDHIGDAEPVGAYVNDNVMLTNGVVCLEDGRKAREVACAMGISYLQSLVFYYHDTFPVPEGVPIWPQNFPEPTLEDIESRINEGYMLCGDPDEVLEQARRYESVGCDQLVFGMPINMPWESAHETIRLMAEHVIPKLDTDPVYRTDRFRNAAAEAAAGTAEMEAGHGQA
jgi:alkanesulfonate monooxygenase SsuD/methylene tetrahydromethanopterin reductase-like flavin-dependent oxidoreductase (luciferase family)